MGDYVIDKHVKIPDGAKRRYVFDVTRDAAGNPLSRPQTVAVELTQCGVQIAIKDFPARVMLDKDGFTYRVTLVYAPGHRILGRSMDPGWYVGIMEDGTKADIAIHRLKPIPIEPDDDEEDEPAV